MIFDTSNSTIINTLVCFGSYFYWCQQMKGFISLWSLSSSSSYPSFIHRIAKNSFATVAAGTTNYFCNRTMPSRLQLRSDTAAASSRRAIGSISTTDDNGTPSDKVPKKKKKTKAVKKVTVDTTGITTDPLGTAAAPIVPVTSLASVTESDKPWYEFYTKGDAEYEAYMASEWGYEQHDDHRLFEKISLEGAQSGLSWRTILHKREAYRATFHHFDPVLVATMDATDIERILNQQPMDSTDKKKKNTRTVIVRHRGKIESVINNAKCVLQMRAEYQANTSPSSSEQQQNIFAHFLWSFVDHKPILYRGTLKNLVSKTTESTAMSNELKRRGFKFVGPTTCYAMMQATGMVIDHPFDTPEWHLAYARLQQRPGGYQDGLDP
jgi:DNA-3-methyladenine glycosylase I